MTVGFVIHSVFISGSKSKWESIDETTCITFVEIERRMYFLSGDR